MARRFARPARQDRHRTQGRTDAAGNLGDAKSVGGGVSELRVDVGPGYRLYFTRRRGVVVILLCGGDKRSQKADIARAQRLATEQ